MGGNHECKPAVPWLTTSRIITLKRTLVKLEALQQAPVCIIVCIHIGTRDCVSSKGVFTWVGILFFFLDRATGTATVLFGGTDSVTRL
jgi:hypothetical protein